MAIKVNGTTVIDDSRNLVNIVSGAGSSTTYGDVGTYTWGRPYNTTDYNGGDTASGIIPTSYNNIYDIGYFFDGDTWRYTATGTSLSGTWRAMGRIFSNGSSYMHMGLWVRIS